jgi:hypothetical protein
MNDSDHPLQNNRDDARRQRIPIMNDIYMSCFFILSLTLADNLNNFYVSTLLLCFSNVS